MSILLRFSDIEVFRFSDIEVSQLRHCLPGLERAATPNLYPRIEGCFDIGDLEARISCVKMTGKPEGSGEAYDVAFRLIPSRWCG